LHWQVGRRGIPLPLAELAEKMVSWRVGLDYNRFRIGSLTAGITAPILLYQGSADTVVPPFLAARLAKTLSHQVTYIPVPGANHVASIDVDPVGYRLALDHFLSVEP
jgi:pimeloyl-ACP methyl ester carboxylesterase